MKFGDHMTRKATITQAELKRFANLATAEGVTVEIEREGTIIRIMPFKQAKTTQQDEEGNSLPRGPNALQEWRELQEKRFGPGQNTPAELSKARRSKKLS